MAELEHGKSVALRQTLKPGTYIPYCNVPAPSALGMSTLIYVAGKAIT